MAFISESASVFYLIFYKLLDHRRLLLKLAFYSVDPSSNPVEAYNFFCKIVFEKNENKQKEAGVGPLFLIKKW